MDKETRDKFLKGLDPKLHKHLIELFTVEGKEKELQLRQERAQRFADLYYEVLGDISNQYIEGTMEYIITHYPAHYHAINEAEDTLNSIWLAGIKGEPVIEAFKEALTKWHKVHIEAINLYAKRKAARTGAQSRPIAGAQPQQTQPQQAQLRLTGKVQQRQIYPKGFGTRIW